MNKSIAIWKSIAEDLQNDIPVMLLYVVESRGSSPGRQGFFMAVNSLGKMEGSIGGGIMEHKFVEMAKEQLLAASDELREGVVKKQVHDKSATRNQSGMICSGEQTVLLYPVKKKEITHIELLISCLEQNKNGTLQLTQEGISFTVTHSGLDFEFVMVGDEEWLYRQRIGYKNHLFIIGGGHCALAFSQLMSRMDFYIHLFEDREDLHTMNQNDFVHVKKIVGNYRELNDLIESGENHYVVIMTFGYRTDGEALRALMRKQFKYIGLLGSKKKIEKMFSDYRKEGFDDELINKIHAPVGLYIKSQTPEEIAISIAAEIIREKNSEW